MTIFPSIVFSTKKRPKRRHSVFSHHTVDKSDVLTKPFLPLETRISSPSDLIDLVGHPRLTIELPPPPPPLNQQQDVFNSNKSNFGITSPITPIPNQPALDKTLLDVSPSPPPPLPKTTRRTEGPLFSTTRIHFSETLYNTDQGNVRHAPPPILQRRRSSPLPLGSRPQQQQQQQQQQEEELPMPRQDEQDLVYQLRKQYDQEQVAWRQRLHDYRAREEELMDLLESTRAKLDQLQVNADAPPLPSDKTQYHHHHHHHHYYYHYARRNHPTRSTSSSSNSNSCSSHHGLHNQDDADLWKKHRGPTKSIPTFGPPPPGFWCSPYS
ncbi:unnamed protein product [Absidia cylindrospora]